MVDEKLTLIDHLEELRSRVIKSLILIIIISYLTYTFTKEILIILAKPVVRLVFIAPAALWHRFTFKTETKV